MKRAKAGTPPSQSADELFEALKKTEAQLEARISELAMLLEVSHGLTSSAAMDTEALSGFIVESAMRYLPSDSASLLMFDTRGRLRIQASHGLTEEAIKSTVIRKGEGIAGWVAEKAEPLLLLGEIKDERFKPVVEREGIRSAICLPLRCEGRVKGVLNVTNLHREQLFTEDNLRVLLIIGDISAIAMENARLYEQSQRAFLSTIAALAAAIDAKDPCTRGHCQSVANYAMAISDQLGFGKSERVYLESAALLHDVGKIGVSEHILNKPQPLTEQECNIVRLHPYISVQIVKPVEMLSPVLPIIYHHHERWDGNGYLDGLKGEQIPLGARILAVADSFDAMTSDRPYRSALMTKEAVLELRRCSGSQFDPAVVDAFLKALDSVGGDVEEAAPKRQVARKRSSARRA